jgi:hypothetical protein
MALHDEILREIAAGRVPWRFRTRDLKKAPEALRAVTSSARENMRKTLSRPYLAITAFGRMEQIPGITSGRVGSRHSSGSGRANTNSSSTMSTILRMLVQRMKSSIWRRATKNH